MSSNNRYPVYYPFSPWYGSSKAALVGAARDYFGQRITNVRSIGRVPDNLDINTWVFMFIQHSVRNGMITEEGLLVDIARLTELLWDVAVMEIMECKEDDEGLPR